MSLTRPYVARAIGKPLTQCSGSWERSRYEWRLADGGDPALGVAGFLAGHGLTLPASDGRSGSGLTQPGTTRGPHRAHEVCGAALFISAAAGARMIGAPVGAPSPVPAVPDVVAVVYTHSLSAHGDAEPSPMARGWRLRPWRTSWTPAQHAQAVSEVRQAIARGEVYQVNLVGHASAEYAGDPAPALRRVTQLPGARYPVRLHGDGWAMASASPETLIRLEAGQLLTR